MEDVLSVYEQPEQEQLVRLCFDERPCQLLDEVLAPLPLKPGKPLRQDYEYERKGTACVLLAYDLEAQVKIHWSFTVKTARVTLASKYQKANPDNFTHSNN